MTRIFRVIIPVSDIALAERFYGKLLNRPGQRVSEGRHYFDCDGVVLACLDPRADGDAYDARPLPEPLYLAVSDLEAIVQRFGEAGGQASEDEGPGWGRLGEIATRPWGERSFYGVDPFGNPLCFVSSETTFTGVGGDL